jgi:hypothetical protein
MDGLKHPVGEQTPNVYWRRRVAVLAVIVLLGLLLWWIIGVVTEGSAEPSASTSPETSVSPSTSAAASSGDVPDCAAEDLTIATGPENLIFAGDEKPTFTVAVTSAATQTCIVDPAKDSKVVVTSGDETWFDSTTCDDYTVFDSEKFVIEPGASHDLTASWNKGRGEAGCATDLQDGQKGYYWIAAQVQGVSGDKLQFQLG